MFLSAVVAAAVWFSMPERLAVPATATVLQPLSSVEVSEVKLANLDDNVERLSVEIPIDKVSNHAQNTPVASNLKLHEQVAVNELSCSVECVLTLELVRSPYELGDTEYDRALSTVDGLATELKENDGLVQELIELAVNASGNKRQLIISTFMLLDSSERIALGLALSESPYREQRLDGVALLTNPATIDDSVVQMLVELLVVEQDNYVRSSAIQALNQPEVFSGDQAVLALLHNTIASDSDHAVRGEALLVNANLTDNPEQAFSESVDVIRFGNKDYQEYGVRTLEALIHRQTTQNGLELSAQNDVEIRALVTDLMNPEFDDMPSDTRHTLDDLYQRFFRAP